mgnify:CR=1 FL=1
MQVLRAHCLDLGLRLFGRHAVVDQFLDDDLVLEERLDLREVFREQRVLLGVLGRMLDQARKSASPCTYPVRCPVKPLASRSI